MEPSRYFLSNLPMHFFRISICLRRISAGLVLFAIAGNVFAASLRCTMDLDSSSVEVVAEERIPCHGHGQNTVDNEDEADCCASCVSAMAISHSQLFPANTWHADVSSAPRLIINQRREVLYRPPINHLS